MTRFQYFSNKIGSNRPIGYVSLDRFLKAQKDPKPSTKMIFQQIAALEESGDLQEKNKLKQEHLYFFTPCVNLKDGRKYVDIVKFTGLLVLDFDHIDNAQEFKEFLFNEYEFVISAWLSPSKKGVKALISIPIAKNVNEFKQYYAALTDIMEIYEGFDPCNKNSVLPLFQSFDPDLLSRNNFSTFTEKKKIKEYDYTSTTPAPVIVATEKDKKSVYNIINYSINKINDNGHPQLRGSALMLGGYVATGYLDQSEAEAWIFRLIEINPYLQKGVSNYKKTASHFIKEGSKKPLILK